MNAWMDTHGMAGNYTALESYYVQRVLDLVNGLGKSTVGYQEIFDNGLAIPKSTVVDVWKNPYSVGQAELARVTAAGYPALMASGWYSALEKGGHALVDGSHCRRVSCS